MAAHRGQKGPGSASTTRRPVTTTRCRSSLGYRSRKNPQQSCYIPDDDVTQHGVYHTILGPLHMAEAIPAGHQECRLVQERGLYWLVVPYPAQCDIETPCGDGVVALDPGARTFLTHFSETEPIGKITGKLYNTMWTTPDVPAALFELYLHLSGLIYSRCPREHHYLPNPYATRSIPAAVVAAPSRHDGRRLRRPARHLAAADEATVEDPQPTGPTRDLTPSASTDPTAAGVAQHTSQTCPACGNVDAGNRTTPANFKCTRCSTNANADVIDAENIRSWDAATIATIGNLARRPASVNRRTCPGAQQRNGPPAEVLVAVHKNSNLN